MPSKANHHAPVAHVCCAHLGSVPLAGVLPTLSPAEIGRAREYRRYDDCERFVKSRGVLRALLTRLANRAPGSFTLTATAGHKLELRPNQSGLHVSLAHSGDYVLCAVADAPIGVDLELMRPDLAWAATAATWFHPTEQAALATVPPKHRLAAFYEIWTGKEAFLKCRPGADLDDLPSFHVRPEGGPVGASRANNAEGVSVTQPITAPEGYKAALAGPAGLEVIDLAWAVVNTSNISVNNLCNRKVYRL